MQKRVRKKPVSLSYAAEENEMGDGMCLTDGRPIEKERIDFVRDKPGRLSDEEDKRPNRSNRIGRSKVDYRSNRDTFFEKV